MSEGLRLAKPNYIQFGVMTPDQIKALSVVEVTSSRTMDENRRIVDRGLYDLRMGPQSRHGDLCRTCGGDIETCPGHFGHIELAEPIYHPCCEKIIISVMNVICHNCGKLLLDPENPENKSQWNELLNIRKTSDRIALLVDVSRKVKKCEKGGEGNMFLDNNTSINLLEPNENKPIYKSTGCGASHLEVKKDASANKILVLKRIREGTNEDEVLSCKKVLDILSLMKDKEVKLLGLDPNFTHPRNLVLTRLPVIPTIARTSVQTDVVNSSPDDLTTLLAHIVECNNEIKNAHTSRASTTKATEENVERLRKLVKIYIDNNDQNLMVRDKQGRQLKGINQQIKGKSGLIRLNLMGKRLDFTARTVISGDPTISIEQVGVPESVAKTMTYEETVTDFNIEELRRMVQNGDTYPGAKTITPADGVKMLISAMKNNPNSGDVLSYVKKGAKVERHMKDGDFVLFNRQPTLHKVSIMGHRVKVMKYSTFRLNLSVTTPYNADFDGDEMNLHLPQGHAARSEIKNLMLVPENIVVSQMNAPIIGIVQDSLLACYLMTRRNVFLEQHEVMNLVMWLDEWDGKLPEPAVVYPKKLWTGKQMFSAIIPERVNMEGFHPSHNPVDKSFNPEDDTHVFIRKGELHMGMMSGAQLGSGKRGIIHAIWLDVGPDATRGFINGIQRITMNWLLINGFSVGIGDMVPSNSVRDKVRSIISQAIDETNKLFYRACQGSIDRAPGQTPFDAFEVEVQKMLKNTGSENGKIIKNTIHSLNNIRSMVISGSKGSDLNLAQIIGCLGQQSLMGGRIPFKFLSHRALPHFAAYDYSAPAKGYVQNSYLLGLNPAEFFFHAIGGREGVIDTAVKTADIGYTYQKMVKSLEDIVIEYDGTARRAEGEIVQLLFGDDGIDSVYMEMEGMDWITLSDKDYERRYRLKVLDKDNIVSPSVPTGTSKQENEEDEDPFGLIHEPETNEASDEEELDYRDFVWETEKDLELFENTDYSFTKGLESGARVPMKRLEDVVVVKNFGEGWLTNPLISELKSSPADQKLIERYYQRLYKLREDYRASIENGSQSVVLGSIYTDNVMAVPMSVRRVIEAAEISNKVSTSELCSLNPAECVRGVLGLIQKITELGMRYFRNERLVKNDVAIKDETSQHLDGEEDEFGGGPQNFENGEPVYNRRNDIDDGDIMASDRKGEPKQEYGMGEFDNLEFDTDTPSDERNTNFDFNATTKKERFDMDFATRFKKEHGCPPCDLNRPTTIFTLYLMHVLSPKQLCQVKRFNNEALQDVINLILRKYVKCLVAPGEAVGIIAAGSIAQPMTQMTLNTFHSAGVANATVTQGLPRLKEIIGAVEKIKTPSCTIKVAHNMPVVPSMVIVNKNMQGSIKYKNIPNIYHDTGIKISCHDMDKEEGTMDPEDQAKYIQSSLSFTTVNSIEHRRMVVYDPWECNKEDPKYLKYLKVIDNIIKKKAINRQQLTDKQLLYYTNLRSILDFDAQIIRLAGNTGDGLPNAMSRPGNHSGHVFDDSDDSENFGSNSEASMSEGMDTESTGKSSLDSFTSPWVIRIELNKGRMQDRGFRTMDIKTAIEAAVRKKEKTGVAQADPFGRNINNSDIAISTAWKYVSLYIQTSTDNSDNLVLRIRPRLLDRYISMAMAMSFPPNASNAHRLLDSREEERDPVSKCLKDPIVGELVKMPFHFDIPFLKVLKVKSRARSSLHAASDHPMVLLAKEIGNFYVCGMHDISAAYIRKQEHFFAIDRATNAVAKSSQWFVDTEGATKTSFKQLLRLWGIEWEKTMCNDPHIVAETLGIEAARALILNEMRTVMLGASYVNGRHLKLIAEIMTVTGRLLSVDRNGMSKREDLVLLKSSFEKPLVTLLEAGFYSQRDKLCGMSEALMTANVVPVGTGRVSTLLNTNAPCMGVNQEEMDANPEVDMYNNMQQGKGGFDGNLLNPEVTPFNNFMTPKDGGLKSILSGNHDMIRESTFGSIYPGAGIELSPIHETSLSRGTTGTMASCLTTLSSVTSSSGLSMKSTFTSNSRMTSLSLITSQNRSFISSKSNINQLSGSRNFNEATVESSTPGTYTTPLNQLSDDLTPGAEFAFMAEDGSEHSSQEDEAGDVDNLF